MPLQWKDAPAENVWEERGGSAEGKATDVLRMKSITCSNGQQITQAKPAHVQGLYRRVQKFVPARPPTGAFFQKSPQVQAVDVAAPAGGVVQGANSGAGGGGGERKIAPI